jgi:hypothetical protein
VATGGAALARQAVDKEMSPTREGGALARFVTSYVHVPGEVTPSPREEPFILGLLGLSSKNFGHPQKPKNLFLTFSRVPGLSCAGV